jgi:hypothetical protein
MLLMKDYLKHQLVPVALIAVLSGVIHINAQATEKQVIDIDVTGARPLADALRLVQERIGFPINYEEAKYTNTLDVQKSASPGMKGRLVPRGGHFVTSVDVAAGLVPDLKAGEAAHALLAAYIGANLPGVYKVVQENGRVSIVPSQVLDSRGAEQAASPVMDIGVTVPYASNRSVINTLQLVTESLSNAIGTKVVLLTQPFQEQDTITLGVDDEPAKNVIKRVSTEFGGMIGYQLLYDPQISTYFLNLIPVSQSVPKTKLSKPTIEGAHSPNSPFFVKTKK